MVIPRYVIAFQGRFYWIFDEKMLAVKTSYKRRIRDQWRGIVHNVDAAMNINEYHVNFFSADK